MAPFINMYKSQVGFCRELLKRTDFTLHGHYKLDGAGRVVGIQNTRGEPDLLGTRPVEDHERGLVGSYHGERKVITAETVRQAARALMEAFPEIHFEFNQTIDMIEYTATVRPYTDKPM